MNIQDYYVDFLVVGRGYDLTGRCRTRQEKIQISLYKKRILVYFGEYFTYYPNKKYFKSVISDLYC